ncbi:MAG: ABC transporter ATP-binding protein [Gemmatimonadetes bacterium]|nr:ABC transporter ATP-binding protein [Gemmatimonadota bacterium]MYB62914.1 ABC transporter ATP-binding protein [Gemmatimonadota bacterium]
MANESPIADDRRTDEVLSARSLTRDFLSGNGRLEILKGIDIEIRRGQIVAIHGASGAGKSTLLHILGTLDRPTSGQVFIGETNAFDLPDDRLAEFRNRTVGFVFQAHHLLPEFSALENVMMPLLVGRCDWNTARDRAGSLLAEVGLAARLDHKPVALSGGEQQRVAVARALVGRPHIVLADEPSGNLDRGNGEALLDLMWDMSRRHGQAFVVVTHDEDLGRRADRAFRLEDGLLNAVAA